MDPAYWGTMRWGYFRWGSLHDEWDQLLSVFEGIGSCNVTRRKLSFGTRDATTRWREKLFTEDTVKAIYIPRSSAQQALKAGTYVRLDALLLTAAGFFEADEVKLPNGEYFEVKAKRDHYSTPDSFSHRELDLTHLPLHE